MKWKSFLLFMKSMLYTFGDFSLSQDLVFVYQKKCILKDIKLNPGWC